MLFSQTCEYALRAVSYIAQHRNEGPVLAKDIAGKMKVPLPYLQKVLRDLVRAGVLTSSRGIGGGFQLSQPAKEVRLADVIAPFDDVLNRPACPFGNPLCGRGTPCPDHDRWTKVVQAYREFLETTTVEDLVKEAQRACRRA